MEYFTCHICHENNQDKIICSCDLLENDNTKLTYLNFSLDANLFEKDKLFNQRIINQTKKDEDIKILLTGFNEFKKVSKKDEVISKIRRY